MSGIVSKTEHGQIMNWWSDGQVEAALCLWELSLTNRCEGDDSVYDWLRGGEGAASARQRCIELAKDCEKSYITALELGYDTCFDWEFVPRWVREAMRLSEYCELTPPWIDYIGRKIYDEFRLEH